SDQALRGGCPRRRQTKRELRVSLGLTARGSSPLGGRGTNAWTGPGDRPLVSSTAAVGATGAAWKGKKNTAPSRCADAPPQVAAALKPDPNVQRPRVSLPGALPAGRHTPFLPNSCKSGMEPSTSVKRNVTVPIGSSSRTGVIMGGKTSSAQSGSALGASNRVD